MSDGIQLMLNEDGKAEIYDDTWDIVIHCENEKEFNEAKEKILSMNWIPVTERLPDLWDERYLVSLAWGGVGVMEYKSTGFHNYGSFSPVPIETVTAWMPLPEPWKGEENGNVSL